MFDLKKILNAFKLKPSYSIVEYRLYIRQENEQRDLVKIISKDADEAARHFVELEKEGKNVIFDEVQHDGPDGESFACMRIAKSGDESFRPCNPRPHLIAAIEQAREELRQSLHI